jgi:hypothetical protein
VSANETSNELRLGYRVYFGPCAPQLKWQRLKPYEKFAEMIERHWDGIAAYWKPENKAALRINDPRRVLVDFTAHRGDGFARGHSGKNGGGSLIVVPDHKRIHRYMCRCWGAVVVGANSAAKCLFSARVGFTGSLAR